MGDNSPQKEMSALLDLQDGQINGLYEYLSTLRPLGVRKNEIDSLVVEKLLSLIRPHQSQKYQLELTPNLACSYYNLEKGKKRTGQETELLELDIGHFGVNMVGFFYGSIKKQIYQAGLYAREEYEIKNEVLIKKGVLAVRSMTNERAKRSNYFLNQNSSEGRTPVNNEAIIEILVKLGMSEVAATRHSKILSNLDQSIKFDPTEDSPRPTNQEKGLEYQMINLIWNGVLIPNPFGGGFRALINNTMTYFKVSKKNNEIAVWERFGL